jgi:hypothetical protein
MSKDTVFQGVLESLRAGSRCVNYYHLESVVGQSLHQLLHKAFERSRYSKGI